MLSMHHAFVDESKDDPYMPSDKRTLYRAVREYGVVDSLSYVHQRPATEPLLWVSDAVAWCYVKGGDWRRRIEPLIETVIRL